MTNTQIPVKDTDKRILQNTVFYEGADLDVINEQLVIRIKNKE